MSSAAIMDAIVSKIKMVLSEAEEVLASDVTPQQAEEVNRLLGEAMSAGWTEGLRTWLATAETDAETIEVNDVTLRYKLDSEKEFLTPGGIVKLVRRVYQPDAGGKCYVPLDAAWGMEGQFATVEVRDAALYAVALGTPREAETLLAKCALFQPSATAIKRMAKQMGQWLEGHEDDVLAEIRDEEPIPDDRAPTLKAKFERELHETESRLSDDAVRIALCDGARGLWSYLDENPQYDDYEKLVDYHHTTEHLSKAAEAIFGKGSRKAQDWYDKYCSKLKGEDGGAGRVLRSLDYYERTARLSKSRREALDRERTFFARNGHRMDYARFRRNGWPIGSGPVEAACKSVVKTRLCRSGMRWSRSGGQHILSLRTYVKSDRWNPLWTQYKRIERSRSPCDTT